MTTSPGVHKTGKPCIRKPCDICRRCLQESQGGRKSCEHAYLSKPAVTGKVGYLDGGACAAAAGLSAALAVAVVATSAALSSRVSEEVDASRAAAGATMGPPLVASAAVCCVSSACNARVCLTHALSMNATCLFRK